MLYKRAMD